MTTAELEWNTNLLLLFVISPFALVIFYKIKSCSIEYGASFPDLLSYLELLLKYGGDDGLKAREFRIIIMVENKKWITVKTFHEHMCRLRNCSMVEIIPPLFPIDPRVNVTNILDCYILLSPDQKEEMVDGYKRLTKIANFIEDERRLARAVDNIFEKDFEPEEKEDG